MKNLLTQIKNEWRSNLFLLVELLLVFAVLWYIVDWVTVTARVYHTPMGFDTEHCYNLSFNSLTPKSALYNPALTAEDDVDALLEITERLRHRPGVECVTVSQNCYPYNEGSSGAFFIYRILSVSLLIRFGPIRISIAFFVTTLLMVVVRINSLLLFPTKL